MIGFNISTFNFYIKIFKLLLL